MAKLFKDQECKEKAVCPMSFGTRAGLPYYDNCTTDCAWCGKYRDYFYYCARAYEDGIYHVPLYRKEEDSGRD